MALFGELRADNTAADYWRDSEQAMPLNNAYQACLWEVAQLVVAPDC